MDNKNLPGNDAEQSGSIINVDEKEKQASPNLFQGRTEAEVNNAKFPDWDIVPPNQFINPRVKQQ
ncbi:MAG TPA: hypothetical protein VF421_09940 [Niabella sp.]